MMNQPRDRAALERAGLGGLFSLLLAAGAVAATTGSVAIALNDSPRQQGRAPSGDILITTQVAKLRADDAVLNGAFGARVAISGDTAVAGAWGVGENAPPVSVFRRGAHRDASWVRVATLHPQDLAADDDFSAVAISGDTIVVGARLHDGAGRNSGAAYLFQRDAGGTENWGQVAKLLDPTSSNFGVSVSIDGDTLAVRASGSAHVFVRDSGGPNNWGQVAELPVADGGVPSADVSVSGNTIVVGAQNHVEGGIATGAAFVFEQDAGGASTWGQVARLLPPGVGRAYFGKSVSISGDRIVVGADYSDWTGTLDPRSGAAFVYERTPGGAEPWTLVARLDPPEDIAHFADGVSINGDTILVGASFAYDAGIRSGVAYLFQRALGGADPWIQAAKLVPSDPMDIQRFGASVALSGDSAFVGARGDDEGARDSGSAYLFKLGACAVCSDGVLDVGEGCDDGNVIDGDGCSATCTAESCTDTDGDGFGVFGSAACPREPLLDCDDTDPSMFPGAPEACNGVDDDCDTLNDEEFAGIEIAGPFSVYFGAAVAFGGDTAVVGARNEPAAGIFRSGSAYVFERGEGGAGPWVQTARLIAPDAIPFLHFGGSVAINGDWIFVGTAVGPVEGRTDSVYLFGRNSGGLNAWGHVATLDAQTSNQFGAALSVSGDTLVVGAYDAHENYGSLKGEAFVFQRDAGGLDHWGEVADLTPTDSDFGDWFGFSVSISGDTIVAGTPHADDFGVVSGAAYVFERDAGGADAWAQVAKLVALDGSASGVFGKAVAISGNTIVVGADEASGTGPPDSGVAYVFERNAGGTVNWGQVARLAAADAQPEDQLGEAVSIFGDRIAVGVRNDDDKGTNSGSVHVFERNAGGADNWGRVAKLAVADNASGGLLGSAIAINGDEVLAGAVGSDSARLFDLGAAAICGDGILGCGEACDDGNAVGGDGCSSACQGEPCIDVDGDGFGVPSSKTVGVATVACPGGAVPDCNDSDPAVSPGAAEICNGLDDDCDGLIDEDAGGVDTDGDGIRNACDNCPAAFNPGQHDVDGDGRADACDNCVEDPNADQTDSDCSGQGDVCDGSCQTAVIGVLSELHDDGDFRRAECFGEFADATSISDAVEALPAPPVLDGYYYLRRDRCSGGSFGRMDLDDLVSCGPP